MKHSTKEKLEIKGRRIFSETLKKQLVKDLVSKRVNVHQLMREHQVSATTVYRWLYKYSPFHEQKCTLVVQMESEATINGDLQKRIAELERAVGQKQLEIDFLNKLFEVGSTELGFDLKKNFSTQPSNGSDVTKLKGAS
jgi:transposase-like protein